MQICQQFKNPEESSDSDDVVELPAANWEDAETDDDISLPNDWSSDETDYDDPSYVDPIDDSLDEITDSDNENPPFWQLIADSKASCSNKNRSDECSDTDSAENDETIKAIRAAVKNTKTCPPEIILEDFVTDISFHPERNIIALATITGDVVLYEYSNEGNKVLKNIELHAKACRDVEFTQDGRTILTCSKDKSIMVTDMESEKLTKFYESAHDEAINKLYVIDENIFATGDDGGTVKLWDLRTKNEIFALKEVEDYISQILTNDDGKLLMVTSGDGYLTTLNIAARKLYVQSEPYEDELTCMGIYRGDSKVVVGTSKGNLYSFNWGQFGYHGDKYPAVKSSMSAMIPITDRIGCVAGEEGIIRAVHIAPFRNLGVVGQHSMPIESMDINHSGELIASTSHNNDVRFWTVKYLEELYVKCNLKHNSYKEKQHNLPSSKFSNTSDFFSDLAKDSSDCE